MGNQPRKCGIKYQFQDLYLINLCENGISRPANTGRFSEYKVQAYLENNTKLELPD